MVDKWQQIVASSLEWEEAHVPFEAAVASLSASLRGVRPDGVPHSAWEIVEHIRLTQADLVDFMENSGYRAPVWPRDYWPGSPAPSSDSAWEESIAAVRRDRGRLQRTATRAGLDLTARIPWGDGQTFLRTILVAVDHSAYHVGQLILVRRLLGAWPAA